MTRATLGSSDGRSCSDGSSTCTTAGWSCRPQYPRRVFFRTAGGDHVLLKSAYRPLQSLNAATTSVTAWRTTQLERNHFRNPILDLYLALLRKLRAQNLDSRNRKTKIRGPSHRYAQGPKIAVRVLVTPASSIFMMLRSIATRTSCERGRNGKRDATGTDHEGPHRAFGSMTCPKTLASWHRQSGPGCDELKDLGGWKSRGLWAATRSSRAST